MTEKTKRKREKIKEKLLEFEKEAKKLGRDLTIVEKNKIMLNLMTKKETEEEVPEEEVVEKKKKEKHRKFKCTSCRIQVELYGETEPEKEGLCTKCSEVAA